MKNSIKCLIFRGKCVTIDKKLPGGCTKNIAGAIAGKFFVLVWLVELMYFGI